MKLLAFAVSFIVLSTYNAALVFGHGLSHAHDRYLEAGQLDSAGALTSNNNTDEEGSSALFSCATPELSEEHKEKEQSTIKLYEEKAGRRLNLCKQCIKVDLYFHVITDGDGTGEIDRDHINEQVKILNDSYAETTFKFKLKEVTTTHDVSLFDLAGGSIPSIQSRLGDLLRRGDRMALNVYSLRLRSRGLGIATYPSGYDGVKDGVFIDDCTIPGESGCGRFGNGMILVHELGHWFGLLHTFEGGCDEIHGDYVSDTPPQMFARYSCSTGTEDSCPLASGFDPVDNYMGYSIDCYTGFTPGQIQRMYDEWMVYRVGSVPCAADEGVLSLELKLDRNPEENSWRLYHASGQIFSMASFGEQEEFRVVNAQICVPLGAPMVFTLLDEEHNGIGADPGSYFRLRIDGKLIHNDRTFQDRGVAAFTALSTEACPAGQEVTKIELRLDGSPREISWYIADDDSSAVYEEPTYDSSLPSYEYATIYRELCLPFGVYTLKLYDQLGDGFAYTGADETPFYRVSTESGVGETQYWSSGATRELEFVVSEPRQPSATPSGNPSTGPSNIPTNTPSQKPTAVPSSTPTKLPSMMPSRRSSSSPSTHPTTFSPTTHPTSSPSAVPSMEPTIADSTDPSTSPTTTPTWSPSSAQSVSPSIMRSLEPTDMRSAAPSVSPTSSPTSDPSALPSHQPTVAGSSAPSSNPSAAPSLLPTVSSSIEHTDTPTYPSVLNFSEGTTTRFGSPSSSPSLIPTLDISSAPTVSHGTSPTGTLSSRPSIQVSASLSKLPTDDRPTNSPPMAPSASPTLLYSLAPTIAQSVDPSDLPTVIPTSVPSGLSSVMPSAAPTTAHSMTPSSTVSVGPSSAPTFVMSSQPSPLYSWQPSALQSDSPSSVPSSSPTQAHSTSPTQSPTTMPSAAPSASATDTPSVNDSVEPSQSPTKMDASDGPSSSPTAIPSSSPSSSAKPDDACPDQLDEKYYYKLDIDVPSVTCTDSRDVAQIGSLLIEKVVEIPYEILDPSTLDPIPDNAICIGRMTAELCGKIAYTGEFGDQEYRYKMKSGGICGLSTPDTGCNRRRAARKQKTSDSSSESQSESSSESRSSSGRSGETEESDELDNGKGESRSMDNGSSTNMSFFEKRQVILPQPAEWMTPEQVQLVDLTAKIVKEAVEANEAEFALVVARASPVMTKYQKELDRMNLRHDTLATRWHTKLQNLKEAKKTALDALSAKKDGLSTKKYNRKKAKIESRFTKKTSKFVSLGEKLKVALQEDVEKLRARFEKDMEQYVTEQLTVLARQEAQERGMQLEAESEFFRVQYDWLGEQVKSFEIQQYEVALAAELKDALVEELGSSCFTAIHPEVLVTITPVEFASDATGNTCSSR